MSIKTRILAILFVSIALFLGVSVFVNLQKKLTKEVITCESILQLNKKEEIGGQIKNLN